MFEKNSKKLSFLFKKENQIKNVIFKVIGIVFLFNTSCTSKRNLNNLEVQGNGLNKSIKYIESSEDYELTSGSEITKQDLTKLEYFLLNTSFQTSIKINVIQEYIIFLSKKYNLSVSEVSKVIEEYFKVPSGEELKRKLIKTKPALLNLKRDISIEYGIMKPVNDQISDRFYFLSDSTEVSTLKKSEPEPKPVNSQFEFISVEQFEFDRIYSACAHFDEILSDNKYIEPNNLTASIKGKIEICFKSTLLNDYHSEGTLTAFRSYEDLDKDLYFRSTHLINKTLLNFANDSKEYFKLTGLLSNPVSIIRNYLMDINSNDFKSSDGTSSQIKFIQKYLMHSKNLVNAKFLNLYIHSILKLAPYLNVYNANLPKEVNKVLTDYNSKVESTINFYEDILELANLAIIQRSFMDGAQISDISLDDMKKINAEPNKDCSLNQNIDSKKCFYQLNPIARKNLLTLMLVKEMIQQNVNINAYSSFYSTDTDVLLTRMRNYFDNDTWLFEIIDGKVKAKVAGVYEEVPTADDMIVPEFSYSLEMKLMLAARENLIDLIADMKQNRIEDEGVRRLLMQATLRKAL